VLLPPLQLPCLQAFENCCKQRMLDTLSNNIDTAVVLQAFINYLAERAMDRKLGRHSSARMTLVLVFRNGLHKATA
jgi:hypothetical protein